MPFNYPDQYNQLLKRHKQHGVLIDSNLLLLFTIGSFNQSLVGRYNRLSKYTEKDFLTITHFIKYFEKIITTPHILTEVSNLSNMIDNKIKTLYFDNFYTKLKILEESNISFLKAFEDSNTRKFGLTDAGITVIAREKYLVLTDDFPLSGYLEKQGIDVINFNHLRYLSYFK